MHRRAVVTALVVALAVAGCGGGDDDDPEPGKRSDSGRLLERVDTSAPKVEGDHDEIKRVLAERSRALERRSAEALLRTAAGAQRARDRLAVRRLAELPLADVRLAGDDVVLDGDRAKLRAAMTYRVRGATRPFLTVRRIELRKRGNRWRVTRDLPRDEPLPWEVDAFAASRAPHVVLLTPDGIDPAALLPGLSSAYSQIERDLPARDLPGRVLVIAARDTAQTNRLGPDIVNGVVALADVRVEYEPNAGLAVERVLAQRMIVVHDSWALMPEVERQRTLVHEMVHTAMNPDTSGRVPPWLAEGVAMHVSGEDLSTEAAMRASGAATSVRLAEMSRPRSILRMNADTQSAAYAAASAATEEIVARRGRKGLFRFYEAFNDSGISGLPGPGTTDRVLRKTLKLSLKQLDAAIAR